MISIFTAGGIALLIAGFGTPILLRSLRRHRVGQQIREDGPVGHIVKAGTPTMGGIAMIAAILGGYLLGHLGTGTQFSRAGLLVVGAVVLAGVVGFADDWLKVRRRRSLGLNKRAKLAFQIVIGLLFSLGALHWGRTSTNLSFTRYDLPGLHLPSAVWVLFAIFVIVAFANAVNLTDGLDGLAAGSTAFGATCLTLIAYWEYRHLSIYVAFLPTGVGAPELDLALASVAIGGACVGFLWWNAAPARIFMGDTGSLAIGTGLACLALEMNVQLLLPIVGGLFVIETCSVVVQVISFRVFGRRVLRMAPLHHHFELLGWPETTVIVRFWILGALFAALALGIFYADFLSVHSV